MGRDLNKRVKELWPLFIEKAYAKVFGSYESLKGGNSHLALATFTGGFGECIFTQKKQGKIDAASGKMWKDMKKWHDQHHLWRVVRYVRARSARISSFIYSSYSH